ncbi:hypothetical protein [Corallococcus sp. M7]
MDVRSEPVRVTAASRPTKPVGSDPGIGVFEEAAASNPAAAIP